MKLIVQPENGIKPIVDAIRKAERSIDAVIFRADLEEFRKALEAAVERGVAVRAMIAHTNRGGEKRLRKLEQALLKAGVTVSRTGDDLVRYHGKMLVIDRRTLWTLGFNFTSLDVFGSRSLGIITRHKALVQEALKLFEADATRQPYVPAVENFVVSPENARARLTALIKGARRQLLIYDPRIADAPIIRLLQERARAGVEVRILGKVTSRREELQVEKLTKLRLHVRAILRDDQQLFVGSQSLRPVELNRRREIGVIVRDQALVRQFRAIFEIDWTAAVEGRKPAKVKAEPLVMDQENEPEDAALAAK
jgi:phosphatidylserine/phosphatidylglycerophosphate/cardiolipin synthase-like enzyme